MDSLLVLSERKKQEQIFRLFSDIFKTYVIFFSLSVMSQPLR